MELKASCKYIFYPCTHPQPVGWIKRKKGILNVVMLHIKIKGKEVQTNVEANVFDLTHTPDIWVTLKCQILILYRVIFFIELSNEK